MAGDAASSARWQRRIGQPRNRQRCKFLHPMMTPLQKRAVGADNYQPLVFHRAPVR